VLALYPLVLLSVFVAGTLQGCIGNSSYWFCGLQGALIAPVLSSGLAALVLKVIHIKRWLAIVLPSTGILLAAYLTYSKYSNSLPIDGVVVWVSFSVIAGLLYALLYSLLGGNTQATVGKGSPLTPTGPRITKRYTLVVAALVLISLMPFIADWANKQINNIDIQTAKDIDVIASAMDHYSQLPGNLTQISPVLHELWAGDTYRRLDRYEYRITAGNGYTLCANFKRESREQNGVVPPHPEGRICVDIQKR
jgi:hypothetical protein